MSYFLRKGGGGWPGGMQGLGATVASTVGPASYDCNGTPCDSSGNPLPPAPPGPTVVDTINSVFGWMMPTPTPTTSAGCARVVPSVDGTSTECVDANGNVVGTVDPTTGAVSPTGGFPWSSAALLGAVGVGAYFLLRRKK